MKLLKAITVLILGHLIIFSSVVAILAALEFFLAPI